MASIDPVKYLSSMEAQLFSQPKIRFEKIKNGTTIIPNEPGVYLIHEKEGVCYVGETGNLQGRMKDMVRTVNHSFRRTLGNYLYSSHEGFIKATSNSAAIELSYTISTVLMSSRNSFFTFINLIYSLFNQIQIVIPKCSHPLRTNVRN